MYIYIYCIYTCVIYIYIHMFIFSKYTRHQVGMADGWPFFLCLVFLLGESVTEWTWSDLDSTCQPASVTESNESTAQTWRSISWLVVWNISYFSTYSEVHHPNWLICFSCVSSCSCWFLIVFPHGLSDLLVATGRLDFSGSLDQKGVPPGIQVIGPCF